MFPTSPTHPMMDDIARGTHPRVPSAGAPPLLAHRHLIQKTAGEALRAGLSCIPVRADGTKRPAIAWRRYQRQLPTPGEITCWFGSDVRGLALITGAVSGHLEALDFDQEAVWQAWSDHLRQLGYEDLYHRLTQSYLEATPHGRHLLYRWCQSEGNQRLAAVPTADLHQLRPIIETRGEGGLIIVAPSAGSVHPSGVPYVLLAGSLSTLTTITAEERQVLFAVARSFDRAPTHTTPRRERLPDIAPPLRERPGDRYNRCASWREVLEPHGWKLLLTRSGVSYWQRPGKEGQGISATTNYRGSDLLYVFSTATVFEAGRAYSKFTAYAILNHDGNFSAAARTLSR